MTIRAKLTNAELLAWRDRLGLNQGEAATALGIGRTSLRRYEEGEVQTPLTVALAAAAVAKGLKPIGSGR